MSTWPMPELRVLREEEERAQRHFAWAIARLKDKTTEDHVTRIERTIMVYGVKAFGIAA